METQIFVSNSRSEVPLEPLRLQNQQLLMRLKRLQMVPIARHHGEMFV